MLFRKSSIVTSIVGFFYVIIVCFVYLDLVTSEEAFYKKFYPTDYRVTFVRELLTYYNKSYGEFYHKVFKYNRTNFAINLTLKLNVEMGYDFEILVQAYKFLSNEYRDFPIHFEYNFCKGFKNNFTGIQESVGHCGYISCPLKKNIQYSLCNSMPDRSRYPPFIPNGRYKLTMDGKFQDQQFITIETYFAIDRPIWPGGRFRY